MNTEKLRKEWMPSYKKYAEEHGLCIPSEAYIFKICNKHHSKKLIEIGVSQNRVVGCTLDCRNDDFSPEDEDHVFEFGSYSCSRGNKVDMFFSGAGEIGFIAENNPEIYFMYH
jgi:hypothetical protein